MQKNCKNCKKDFEIHSEDLSFYKKMKAPVPNYCPQCRIICRLAFRNERTLYKRTCSKSGKSIISIYPPNTPFPVYDQKVYHGDDWDPISYGMDYDFNRSFFEQFLELKNKVPRISLLAINCVGGEYVNNTEDSKNCYLIFAAQKNEDSMYSRLIYRSKFVVDSAFVADCEFCYENIDCRKCYKCFFSESCESSMDLLFCFDLKDCQNCIFSTNLRHKNYYIFNKPCTKEEFENKKAEIFKNYSSLEEAKRVFEKIKEEAIVKFSHQVKCHNSTGDYMYNCHDVSFGFDTENAKNCKYVADAETPLDCYDLNNSYYNPELCLDIMGLLRGYNCKHCVYVFYVNNLEYCDSLENCDDCFGCVGLKKKKYCILNKQYSKEEYFKLKELIIESMKKNGTYGDFFPPSLSPFGFNETLGYDLYSISKDEVQERGFNWSLEASGIYGKETIREEEMPETIAEVGENILNEVLICKDCQKNFRITQAELDFYKRMNLPLPHKDFECRHRDRMKKRNPRQLWHRVCMCELKNHFHGKNKCNIEFETSYSFERKEKIYCEQCYQQEVS